MERHDKFFRNDLDLVDREMFKEMDLSLLDNLTAFSF